MDKVSVNDIVISDIPEIARYLAIKSPGVYSEADWLQIMQWIWVDNPNISPGQSLGWLIRDEEKNIRGVLGSIPVYCAVYGETKKCFWATTWFVDENVRNESMGLFMRYLTQKGLLMSNTPNDSVEKMLVKLFKYKRADSPWFHGSYLFPLRPVRGFFSARQPSTNYLKRTAVCLLGLFLKLPQAIVFLQWKSNRIPGRISVERIHDFDKETDNWFSEFANCYPCVLNRSAAMYGWIFCHESQRKKFIVFQVSYDNKIQGYLVFKKKYHAGHGFAYIELVDEALLPLTEKIKKTVMLQLYHEVNKIAGVESLLVMRSNDESIRSVFRRWMGIPVRKVEKTYYKETFLKPGETPFLTSIDGDSIFF